MPGLSKEALSIFLRVFGTEVVRVVFAGVLGLFVDAGLMVFLTELIHVPYLTSACVSFVAGLVTSYYLSIYWVFRRRKLARVHTEFLVFVFVGVIGLGLNQLVMWGLTERFAWYYLWSKIVAVIVVFFWNYGVRKWLLF